MKFAMAAILLMITSSLLKAQPSTWREFRSIEGGFSVLMPGTPTPNKVTVSTSSGVREAYMFTSKDENLNDYMISYSYAGVKSKNASTDRLFDKVRDGILLAQKGKLISESAINLDVYRGRAIVVERPDGIMMMARFVLVDDKFYHLSVETKIRESDPQAAKKFLDSFILLPMRRQ